MKKPYISPELTVHGNVETLTQAFGTTAITDTFFSSETGGQIGTGQGSVDGLVTPVTPK